METHALGQRRRPIGVAFHDNAGHEASLDARDALLERGLGRHSRPGHGHGDERRGDQH